MARMNLAGPLCVLLLAAGAASAEEVTHSKYKATAVTVPEGAIVVQAVDQAALEARCRDEDGCLITLELAGTTLFGARDARFFISPVLHDGWTIQDATPRIDGSLATAVLSMTTGNGDCAFTDAESAGGSADNAIGFAVVASSFTEPSPKCVLVVED